MDSLTNISIECAWTDEGPKGTGCGRTMRLYLGVVLALMAGMSIEAACTGITGAGTARNAYRWLARFGTQLTCYRSLSHRPQLREAGGCAAPRRSLCLPLLMVTFEALLSWAASTLM